MAMGEAAGDAGARARIDGRAGTWLVDVGAVAALLVAGWFIAYRVPIARFGPHGVRGYWLGVLTAALPLLVRRRLPWVPLLAVGASFVGCEVFKVPIGNVHLLALLMATFSAAANAKHRLGWLAWMVAAAAAFRALEPRKVGWAELAIVAGTTAMAAGFGDVEWQRKRIARVLDARRVEAEHQAELADELAAEEERHRIASDIDALLRRNVGEMVAAADQAGDALDSGSGAAVALFERVAATGRDALAELRRLLGVLRAEDHPADTVAATDPVPVAFSTSRLPAFVRTPVARDMLLAFVLAAFTAWDIDKHKEPYYVPHYGKVAVVFGVAVALTTLLRRRAPWIALGLGSAIAFMSTAILNLRWSDGIGLSKMALAFSVASVSSWPGALAAGAVAIVADIGVTARGHFRHDPLIAWIGIPLFAVIAGQVVRARALTVAKLDSRVAELAAEVEMRRRIAVARERGRVAREMHDAVAHSLSVMVVQAGGAANIAHRDRERAKQAVAAIQQAGRLAGEELDTLFGVLDAAAGAPAHAFDVSALVDDLRGTVDVDLVVEGDPASVSRGLAVSTFRIVQEALTNAQKHAPGSRSVVHLRFAGHGVDIHVANDAPSPDGVVVPLAATGGGHGVRGMRERAALHGGSLVARPSDDGGFEVRASLPDAVPA